VVTNLTRLRIKRLNFDKETTKLTVDPTRCVWFPISLKKDEKNKAESVYSYRPTPSQSAVLTLDPIKGRYQAAAVAMRVSLICIKPMMQGALRSVIANLQVALDIATTGVPLAQFRKEIGVNLLAFVIAHVYQIVKKVKGGADFHKLILELRSFITTALQIEKNWPGFNKEGLFVAGDAYTVQAEDLMQTLLDNANVEDDIVFDPDNVPEDLDPFA
jgi:hypothetical protein